MPLPLAATGALAAVLGGMKWIFTATGLASLFGLIAKRVGPTFLRTIMVALGFALFILFALCLSYTLRNAQAPRWLLHVALWSLPAPWIAIQFGWFLAEFGRQPWVVEGVLPTFMAVSHLTVWDLLLTIAGFTLAYGTLAVVEVYLMVRAIRKGPEMEDAATPIAEDIFNPAPGGHASPSLPTPTLDANRD